MLNITSTAIANCQFTFAPVAVNRGRKFRGIAYSLGYGEHVSSSNWAYTSYSTKLWDPTNKRYVYANPDFVEDREISAEQLEADKLQYVTAIINSTADWCKSVKPNLAETELKQFIRNVLKKQHPELMSVIDDITPDNRDVVAEVQRTLQWAMTLKTRACWMYGRYCTGGRPLADKRKIEIAMKALEKKGITKLDGFAEVWQMTCTVMGLQI